MVFHWRLSDSKAPQVSRTLLSILAVFTNSVVWIVSTRPPTSKSSRSFNNPLVAVPKAPIAIGIIVTFMFQSFFNSLTSSRYLSLFSHFFQFYSVVCRDSKVDNFADFLFSFLSILLLLLLLSSLRFFLTALADGLSLEFVSQQVLAGLHDSSQYSDPNNGLIGIISLYSSSDFHFSNLHSNPFGTVSSVAATIGTTINLMFYRLF